MQRDYTKPYKEYPSVNGEYIVDNVYSMEELLDITLSNLGVIFGIPVKVEHNNSITEIE